MIPWSTTSRAARCYAFATLVLCLLAAAPTLADAWADSQGSLRAGIGATQPDDEVIWNLASPGDWLLHAEGEVYHMHPPLTHNYGADSELWDPAGDGAVSVGPVTTGCLAEVDNVNAYVAEEPYTGVNRCYTSAHDTPNSYSDAAGLAQHDNLFWATWTGPPEQQPPTTWVNVTLTGNWLLEGDSDPDDNWWADWFGYAEVYGPDPYSPDPGNPDLMIVPIGDEYHSLEGPGPNSGGAPVSFSLSVEILYDTPYALRFWVDAESHSEAIPEPGSAILMLAALTLLGPRRRS